jgi:hypothetical protein
MRTGLLTECEVESDDSVEYTVTFDADGGNPATQTLTVDNGASVGGTMPLNPSKSDYTFGAGEPSRTAAAHNLLWRLQ